MDVEGESQKQDVVVLRLDGCGFPRVPTDFFLGENLRHLNIPIMNYNRNMSDKNQELEIESLAFWVEHGQQHAKKIWNVLVTWALSCLKFEPKPAVEL